MLMVPLAATLQIVAGGIVGLLALKLVVEPVLLRGRSTRLGTMVSAREARRDGGFLVLPSRPVQARRCRPEWPGLTTPPVAFFSSTRGDQRAVRRWTLPGRFRRRSA